jgi:nicotinamide phosphoribosyltransferase
MRINPLFAIDFYKTDHRRQYPEGTTEVYANFTPRYCHLAKMGEKFDKKVVFFGLQYFITDFLINTWNNGFFTKSKEYVLYEYKNRMDLSLGKDAIGVEHIAALHELGYLPIKIKALPEGTRVPIGVPILTIVNTHPDFFWLTNYLETIISCYLWKPITSATIAYEYKKLLTHFAHKTGTPLDFVKYQAHDFSFRGMSGPQDATLSGAAHLTSFYGTDTVCAIDLINQYYSGDYCSGVIGCSVPATEHSVMCMGSKDGELGTFRRLVTEIYPKGIISIVSDTWDFWKVITDYAVQLRLEILAREGKVVFRPDSGDPVKIICGDPDAPVGSPQNYGAVQCLSAIFGCSYTSTGHKIMNPKVGLIYGDSITLDRAEKILRGLEAKGFASGNIVFGVGSYTYQYVTRDTFGFAMKATSGIVNGERREIFKDPVTDNGGKRSAKGLLRVEREGGSLVLHNQQSEIQEQQGLLECVFLNGHTMQTTSIMEIRDRLTCEHIKWAGDDLEECLQHAKETRGVTRGQKPI